MLQLVRYKMTDDSVLGKLYLNGALVCLTMENKRTAIPCGYYKLENSMSPHFKRELPLIYNDTDVKPGRGIRIHCGKDYTSSAGCVLVAMGFASNDTLLKDSKAAETTVTMLCRNNTELVISEV